MHVFRRFATTAAAANNAPKPFLKRPAVWLTAAGIWTGAGLFYARTTDKKPAAAPIPTLTGKDFIPLALQSVETLSHNTAVFRFALPSDAHVSGMTVASCLLTKAELDVKNAKGEVEKQVVVRPYTPISEPEQKGFMDLLVKKYPNGPMSEHFFSLKPGQTLLFKGPIVKIAYEANKWRHVGMIAGGTGITPMLQVIQESLKNGEDKTKISLLFGNVTPDDVLVKKELDALAAKHPDRFSVHYTVDRPTPEWKGFGGYVTTDMLQKAGLPTKPEPGVMVFVCGNNPMVKVLCGEKNPDKSQGPVDPQSLLGRLGFTNDNVFKF